jgi:hypothetical protein
VGTRVRNINYQKKMKHSHIIISLIIISCLLLIFAWFYNNFNYISETVEIGYQGEARTNPVLAAERFLERMGTSAESHILDDDLSWDFFEGILNREDTLILLNKGRDLTEDQEYLLLRWVKAGGHLIMAAQQNDALLKQFRITLSKNDLDENDIAQASPIAFYWQGYPLQVAFNPNYDLQPFYEPQTKISDESGTYALFYYFSQGNITILSDLAFIKNNKIAEYDNAQFLWHLVNIKQPVTQVFFLRNHEFDGTDSKTDMPSLWQLLWTNMSAVIISAMLLLLFWLWTVSRRFGFLLPEPPRARRRLLEHLEASGQFFWKQDQAVMLLNTARKALLKRLESEYPDWTQLSPKKLSQQLAQISDLSADEIKMALQETTPKTELVFTKAIQVLTKIRKIL